PASTTTLRGSRSWHSSRLASPPARPPVPAPRQARRELRRASVAPCLESSDTCRYLRRSVRELATVAREPDESGVPAPSDPPKTTFPGGLTGWITHPVKVKTFLPINLP